MDQPQDRKSNVKFVLHKWNSNKTELENTFDREEVDTELSFAKKQAGTEPSESKILGLPWDKKKDTLAVTFPQGEAPATKRGILKKLAKVYYPCLQAMASTQKLQQLMQYGITGRGNWIKSLNQVE